MSKDPEKIEAAKLPMMPSSSEFDQYSNIKLSVRKPS